MEAIMHIPDSARQVLESASPAHIATINPDGSPHLTMVWVAVDGEELLVPHLHRYRKLDNIQRDPRIALTVQGAAKCGAAARFRNPHHTRLYRWRRTVG
jgi:PPOX class probable F420-dependent enzyme